MFMSSSRNKFASLFGGAKNALQIMSLAAYVSEIS